MNAFLQKQKAIRSAMVEAGMQHGEQFAVDMMQIALHESGWGYDRIKRLTLRMGELSAYYSDAFKPGPEQDVAQEHLDRALLDIIKGKQDLIPFMERYPYTKKIKY